MPHSSRPLCSPISRFYLIALTQVGCLPLKHSSKSSTNALRSAFLHHNTMGVRERSWATRNPHTTWQRAAVRLGQ
ncbi:hypothetical protein CC85DRAFT_287245 [Cutaneotrichosporon oleaginosum]|uniref:Uncharacterized protein n=1 Tax=Cutaneotrichosporon oleaginosum TaxID=879819 RepID=A0A0J1AZ60_9TREE|nr:uncharacterized protein CC85DRAFT_287245 [Cutaneotrichosporon oleaginosum]KLT40624.1 hypothetical protein CC85DRAFT_287245 [Cutaneotrichosporon oleaginosum]TXT12434.1 hypothetical protein COLE_02844 [Cutaneotrichosporon oleaginosum]